MRQYAPYPAELADLVSKLRYRPGWHFELKDIERDHADSHGGAAGGLTFIGITGDYDGPDGSFRGAMDAYRPGRPRPVYFYFPVPAATFNRAAWQRWLFERILDVERHEAMEHFAIGETVDPEVGGLCRCGHPATLHDGRYSLCADCEGEHRFDPAEPRVEVRRPFAPTHGPGDDPYVVHEYGSDLQRRTAFTGKLNDEG